MSEHKATISWRFSDGDFLKGRYSRDHLWSFDGGLEVPASSSPSVIRPPYSNPANVDPEQAFVASLASCHMMTFLFLAARSRFEVTAYRDEVVGVVTKGENGIPWVSSIVLSPVVEYTGKRQPSGEQEEKLHQNAHDQCFIANSVKTVVTVRLPGRT